MSARAWSFRPDAVLDKISGVAPQLLCASPLLQIAATLNGKGRLDLIYSHLGLINVDLELATHLGGSNLAQEKKNFISIHKRLADGLALIAKEGKYDLVLIDCPPNFNIVTKNGDYRQRLYLSADSPRRTLDLGH
jgi:chromosome partitioning protein